MAHHVAHGLYFTHHMLESNKAAGDEFGQLLHPAGNTGWRIGDIVFEAHKQGRHTPRDIVEGLSRFARDKGQFKQIMDHAAQEMEHAEARILELQEALREARRKHEDESELESRLMDLEMSWDAAMQRKVEGSHLLRRGNAAEVALGNYRKYIQHQEPHVRREYEF